MRKATFSHHLFYFLSWALLLTASGCVTTTNQSTPEPEPVSGVSNPTAGSNDSSSCLSEHPNLRADKAMNINDSGLFVTSFVNTCGRNKVESDSDFSVMGLPCSAGEGTFDFRGERKKASLVRFHLDVGCPMQNARPESVNMIVRNALGLVPPAKAVALNAMSIQIWELPQFSDLGVGEYVALRTVSGVQFFKQMDESTPLRVTLYGKESSWVASKQWYRMEANIYLTGHTSFRAQLLRASLMKSSDLRQLSKKCSHSRFSAACKAVLSGELSH